MQHVGADNEIKFVVFIKLFKMAAGNVRITYSAALYFIIRNFRILQIGKRKTAHLQSVAPACRHRRALMRGNCRRNYYYLIQPQLFRRGAYEIYMFVVYGIERPAV